MRQHQSDDQLQTEDLLGDHRDTDRGTDHETGHEFGREGDETRLDGQDSTDSTDLHRTHSDTDADVDHTVTDADGVERQDWDGTPAYETEPAVDQDSTPGYATDEVPAQPEVRESAVPAATDGEEPGAQLFADDEVERFRSQWQAIQTTFVDDPQDAVRGADHLVAEVMQALAATFTEHKRGLEEQWQSGTEAQTEDLRQALRRYRSFFNQLLHT